MEHSILSILLFFLPFIVLPGSSVPIEIGKVFAFEIGVYVLLFLFWYKKTTLTSGKRGFMHFWPYVLLGGLSVYHAVFAQSSDVIWGNVFRLQGVFLFWHLLLFSVVSGAVPKRSFRVVSIFSLMGLVFAGFWFRSLDTLRLVGTLGEPNAYAATLLAVWPIAWSAISKERTTNIFRLILYISVFVCIFFSGSRAGIIGFVLQSIFLVWISYRPSMVRVATISCFILLGMSLILPFFDVQGPLENRAEIWRTAVASIADHPWIGSGFGTVESRLLEGARTLQNGIRFEHVDSAHNVLLDFWLQSGILGVITLCIMVFQSLLVFLEEKNSVYLVVLLGICIAMMFNPVSITTLVVFWWLLGQGIKNT